MEEGAMIPAPILDKERLTLSPKKDPASAETDSALDKFVYEECSADKVYEEDIERIDLERYDAEPDAEADVVQRSVGTFWSLDTTAAAGGGESRSSQTDSYIDMFTNKRANDADDLSLRHLLTTCLEAKKNSPNQYQVVWHEQRLKSMGMSLFETVLCAERFLEQLRIKNRQLMEFLCDASCVQRLIEIVVSDIYINDPLDLVHNVKNNHRNQSILDRTLNDDTYDHAFPSPSTEYESRLNSSAVSSSDFSQRYKIIMCAQDVFFWEASPVIEACMGCDEIWPILFDAMEDPRGMRYDKAARVCAVIACFFDVNAPAAKRRALACFKSRRANLDLSSEVDPLMKLIAANLYDGSFVELMRGLIANSYCNLLANENLLPSERSRNGILPIIDEDKAGLSKIVLMLIEELTQPSPRCTQLINVADSSEMDENISGLLTALINNQSPFEEFEQFFAAIISPTNVDLLLEGLKYPVRPDTNCLSATILTAMFQRCGEILSSQLKQSDQSSHHPQRLESNPRNTPRMMPLSSPGLMRPTRSPPRSPIDQEPLSIVDTGLNITDCNNPFEDHTGFENNTKLIDANSSNAQNTPSSSLLDPPVRANTESTSVCPAYSHDLIGAIHDFISYIVTTPFKEFLLEHLVSETALCIAYRRSRQKKRSRDKQRASDECEKENSDVRDASCEAMSKKMPFKHDAVTRGHRRMSASIFRAEETLRIESTMSLTDHETAAADPQESESCSNNHRGVSSYTRIGRSKNFPIRPRTPPNAAVALLKLDGGCADIELDDAKVANDSPGETKVMDTPKDAILDPAVPLETIIADSTTCGVGLNSLSDGDNLLGVDLKDEESPTNIPMKSMKSLKTSEDQDPAHCCSSIHDLPGSHDPKVGILSLTYLNLINAFIHMDIPEAWEFLSDFLPHIIDLFFAQKWCSLLHNTVEMIVVYSLIESRSDAGELTVREVVTETTLIQNIVKAIKRHRKVKGDKTVEGRRLRREKMNIGNFAHVLKIAEAVIEASSWFPWMQEYLRDVSGWMKNVPIEVQRMKDRSNKTLGGPLPRELLTDQSLSGHEYDASSSFSDKMEESLSFSDYEVSNECAAAVSMILSNEASASIENNPWPSSCMNFESTSNTDRKYVREHSINL